MWTQKANFPGQARYEAIAFSIGNDGYVGCGANFSTGQIFNDFWSYNPQTNSWSQKANVPGFARYGAMGFEVNGKGYVGTGYNFANTPQNDFYEYDPSLNTWMPKASFIGAARYDACGISSAGYGYTGFGYNGINQLDFYKFDPSTNSWTQKQAFTGSARQSISTFVLNGLIYICGGGNSNGFSFGDCWSFDVTNNTWSQKSNFPTPRFATVSFTLNGKGFVGLGWNNNTSFSDFYWYDDVLNVWSFASNTPFNGRFAGDGFEIGNAGFICLGRDEFNVYYNDLWQYAPAVGLNEVNNTDCNLTYNPHDKTIGIRSGNQRSNPFYLVIYNVHGSQIFKREVKVGEHFIFDKAKGVYVYTISNNKEVLKKGKFNIAG